MTTTPSLSTFINKALDEPSDFPTFFNIEVSLPGKDDWLCIFRRSAHFDAVDVASTIVGVSFQHNIKCDIRIVKHFHASEVVLNYPY